MKRLLPVLALLACGNLNAELDSSSNMSASSDQPKLALDKAKEPFFNLKFGISPFDGILGAGIQKGHYSLSVGMPGRIAVKYFFNPYDDSKFFGAYFGNYSSDVEDGDGNPGIKFHDGFPYEEFEASYYGIGMGYRWQWANGWEVTASVALDRYKHEYIFNQVVTDSERGWILFPGITGGYTF